MARAVVAGVGLLNVLAVERVKVQPPGRWVAGARLGWVWVERDGGFGVGVGVALVVGGRRRRKGRKGRKMRGERRIVF